MPDPIDLEPMKWRSNRRIRHPFENPKNARNAMIAALAVLAIAWFAFPWPDWRAFYVVAVFAFMAGGLFSIWLKDVY